MSTESPPRAQPDRRVSTRRVSWPVAFTLMFFIAAALIALLFWRIETWPVRTAQQGSAELERLVGKLRAAFIDIVHLQPRITIKNRVYLEQTAQAAELATVVRQTKVEHEFLHTWAGSTKRIRLHGIFRVKAGFDLHKNFSVDIRENEIEVRLPPAQILGVEEEKVDVLAFENGYWNRISAEDVENELHVLPQLAREKAAEAGLAAEAERTLKQELEEKIQAKHKVRVLFAPAISPLSSPTR